MCQFPMIRLDLEKFRVYRGFLSERDYQYLGKPHNGGHIYSQAVFEEHVLKKYDVPLSCYDKIPCGHCQECVEQRARYWVSRNALELMHYEAAGLQSLFLTLTYNDINLPNLLVTSPEGRLRVLHDYRTRDVQLFFKRLRQKYSDISLRYFGCSEYGEKGKRPHYHFIVYGLPFPKDARVYKTKSDYTIYISKTLSNIWQLGFVTFGEVNLRTISYVCQYVFPKMDYLFADVLESEANRILDCERYSDEAVQRKLVRIGAILPRARLYCSLKPGIGMSVLARADSYEKLPIRLYGRKLALRRAFNSVHDIKLTDAEKSELVHSEHVRRKHIAINTSVPYFKYIAEARHVHNPRDNFV